MPLEVQPGVDEDGPRFAEIEHYAYKDNPMSPVLFPGPFPGDVLAKRAEGLVENKKNDPQIRWFKVIDTDTKEVIGWAQWEIIDGPKAVQSKDRTFGPGCNVEACEEYFGNIHRKRHALMDGKQYALLNLLQADPKHRRRGVGGLLIQHGLKIADELRLPAFLESSPMGHSLYQKYGFKDVDVFEMDPRFNYAEGADPRIWFMLRDVPIEA